MKYPISIQTCIIRIPIIWNGRTGREDCWSKQIISDRKLYNSIFSGRYGNQKYVHFDEHEYTYTAECFFINKYMRNAYLDEVELVKAARDIEKRCKYEKGYKKQTIKSQGEACARLYEWKLMEDNEIKKL